MVNSYTVKGTFSMTKKININELKLNDANPRFIRDDKFKKLVESLKNFPEMAEVREVVVNTDNVILGGNMRYRAMKEAGWTEVPVKVVDWPEDKQKEFIIKDNVSGGEWDWDLLADEWNVVELEEWGLDLPIAGELERDESYTTKVDSPNYEPTGDQPEIEQLYNYTKTNELLQSIQSADIDGDIKDFLVKAAQRHTVFDYQNIAEYYAHTSEEVQELMEQSALIVIDYEQALEGGFIQLSQELKEIQQEEYNG
jgi:hypothetical protein